MFKGSYKSLNGTLPALDAVCFLLLCGIIPSVSPFYALYCVPVNLLYGYSCFVHFLSLRPLPTIRKSRKRNLTICKMIRSINHQNFDKAKYLRGFNIIWFMVQKRPKFQIQFTVLPLKINIHHLNKKSFLVPTKPSNKLHITKHHAFHVRRGRRSCRNKERLPNSWLIHK